MNNTETFTPKCPCSTFKESHNFVPTMESGTSFNSSGNYTLLHSTNSEGKRNTTHHIDAEYFKYIHHYKSPNWRRTSIKYSTQPTIKRHCLFSYSVCQTWWSCWPVGQWFCQSLPQRITDSLSSVLTDSFYIPVYLLAGVCDLQFQHKQVL